MAWVAAVLLGVVVLGAAAWARGGPARASEDYEARLIAGWSVHLARDVPSETAETVAAELAARLGAIAAALPEKRLAELRSVAIWIERGPGDADRMIYHPVATPARVPAFQRGGISIEDPARLARLFQTQPSALLHELAHAYHDQVLSFERAEIVAAYETTRDAGLYRDVARNDGTTGPAYALTNAQEYFAELTEAYFGENDFFPFTRDELRGYDPAGFELMQRVWEEVPPTPRRRPDPGGCSEGPRSVESETPSRLLVRNGLDRPVALRWIDYRGRARRFGTIAPGSAKTVATFVGHPWRVTDPRGRCLGSIAPEAPILWVDVVP